jgi:hyperosmotically inducible protein
MNTELHHPRPVPTTGVNDDVRVTAFRPKRRIWPGVLAAALLGAGIAAVVVSNYYDSRSMGERLDDTVQAAGQTVQTQVDKLESGAANVARDGAAVGDRMAGALDDTGITAAVKTALAADPALSALKIEVSTEAGVVSLSGPAPDERSRERAAVIAAAPEGVVRVDNRLVVTPSATPGG